MGILKDMDLLISLQLFASIIWSAEAFLKLFSYTYDTYLTPIQEDVS